MEKRWGEADILLERSFQEFAKFANGKPLILKVLTLIDSTMPVKLQTTEYLIYTELNKTERFMHLALKNWIHANICYAILHEIEQHGDFDVTWDLADDGYTDTSGFHEPVNCVCFFYNIFTLRELSNSEFSFDNLFRCAPIVIMQS